MTISTNYTTPVWVNGYQCKNCTDVDEAKKFVDPAHPKSGPFGIDAKSDPSVIDKPIPPPGTAPSDNGSTTSAANAPSASTVSGVGGLVNLTV